VNSNVIIGVTGHQKRKGLDWNWVNVTLRAELAALGKVDRAMSSLAAGADQRFAAVALELNIPVTAVLPMSGYERFLRGRDLDRYRALLARCDQLALDGGARPNEAFLAADGTSSITVTFCLRCGTGCQPDRWAGPAMWSSTPAKAGVVLFTSILWQGRSLGAPSLADALEQYPEFLFGNDLRPVNAEEQISHGRAVLNEFFLLRVPNFAEFRNVLVVHCHACRTPEVVKVSE
jgi:hypothetical protein